MFALQTRVCYLSVVSANHNTEVTKMHKIDPLDSARFDFEVGDEVIVLSTAGAKLGEGKVNDELSPGIYGVTMQTGRYAGTAKGLNGCLLRKKAAPAPGNERRPVAHEDSLLEAQELARLLAGDLAELPAEILANYIAPKA